MFEVGYNYKTESNITISYGGSYERQKNTDGIFGLAVNQELSYTFILYHLLPLLFV